MQRHFLSLLVRRCEIGIENERFVRIACIGLLNPDDTLKQFIPLYVKVHGEMSPEQQKHICEISADLIRQHEKQLAEYFEKLKKEQLKNEQEKSTDNDETALPS